MMKMQAQQGMTMVEYIGGNGGDTSWWGVTGMQYRFGPKHRVRYVYDGDVDALLNVRHGRQPQFKLYVEPKPPIDYANTPMPKGEPEPGEPEVVFPDTPDGLSETELDKIQYHHIYVSGRWITRRSVCRRKDMGRKPSASGAIRRCSTRSALPTSKLAA